MSKSFLIRLATEVLITVAVSGAGVLSHAVVSDYILKKKQKTITESKREMGFLALYKNS